MRHVEYLILGGGLAAASAAETLREDGAEGAILLVCAEPVPPYHRPPLSKRFLVAPTAPADLAVMPGQRYRDLGIELLLSTTATAVDPRRHVVATTGGELGYGRLLVATGCAANPLDVPGAHLAGIHSLRTLADAQGLKATLVSPLRVVIVGASFLGLELASTLSGLGHAVTIVSQDAALFAKLEAPAVSAFLADMARQRGIEVCFAETATAFLGSTAVEAVRTSQGRRIGCDVVVLAVGVSPSVGLLRGSGIKVEDGILVDQHLATSAPDVFAAGDVASQWHPESHRYRRVEHWDSAIKQGRAAARNMLGQRRRYDELSYFYSEVFDLGFEALGFPGEADAVTERGSLGEHSYALLQVRDDIVRAAVILGRPSAETRAIEDLIRYRVKLGERAARLADPGFALASIPAQTVLVLQGGGAMGAFECGVVRAMEERGISPDIVAGVSIGAFNGAIIAGNPGHATAALTAFWEELTVPGPQLWEPGIDKALASWQVLAFGSPAFFRPRWTQPIWSADALPYRWTSLYDTSPARALLERYVDFSKLKSSPVRLFVSAVNVETGELEIFDSYSDELTPAHILASGSLPPGFDWTTIGDRHYWDGGILSNSPIEIIADRCGRQGKKIYAVDLFSARRPLPANLLEVLARRDEIGFAERRRQDDALHARDRDWGRLVEEVLGEVDPARAEVLRQRPRYVQLMGARAPMPVVRIARRSDGEDTLGRDFDFSRRAIEANQAQGYAQAVEAMATAAADKAT